mmetsp:Transcript_125492/g.187410  ORF Transcript_125492/g.187410 Transcript_125492/m.187410 type:complete len:220 (+) Transcript_125492:255-914(+)
MENPVIFESTRPVRMSSLKRLPQPISLFKLLRADEKQLIGYHEDDLKPEQSRSPDTVPLDDSMDSGEESPTPVCAVPEEVTVVSDDGGDMAPVTTISIALMIELLKKRNMRLAGVEAEARQFQLQLQSTQELVDQFARDLNTSRRQVSALIRQNTMLLNELKTVKEKDDTSLETHQMMKAELFALKTCLFVGAIFILFGGKVELIAVMAVGWLAVDLAG